MLEVLYSAKEDGVCNEVWNKKTFVSFTEIFLDKTANNT